MAREEKETSLLIASDKVEGTPVFGANDTKIGSIERLMINKQNGAVSYAVLSFGGFLGIGHDHYPIPWEALKYDEKLEGYKTGITQALLTNSPKYTDHDSWNWADGDLRRSLDEHYGVPFVSGR
jgi:hypothetical protein